MSRRLHRAELSRLLDPHTSMDAEDPRRHVPMARPARSSKASAPSAPPLARQVHLQGDLPVVQALPGGGRIKAWTHAIEANAWKQIQQVAQLQQLHPEGLALMPDVHMGNGACVGSVLPLRGALVPACVGVDIGCGMAAVRLDLHASDLPDTLKAVREAIEAVVPVGQADHGELVKPDAWAPLHERYQAMVREQPKLYKRKAGAQLGTLGGGNHFIEVCLDEQQRVWVMLHSGSRGVGGQIGQHFMQQAARWCDQEGLWVPHRGLGVLIEGTPLFEAYREAVLWAQDYARVNRQVMLDLTLQAMARALGRRLTVTGTAIHCHHNYVAAEQHWGEQVWVTRKGAIRAGAGEWGLIPGSMGAESFVVRGKGNAASCQSCSHGAGRAMSRTEARATFTTKDLRRQTAGVECRKDAGVVDEAPGAYKPIREVMAHQRDLVDIVHTLRQVVCIKG